MHLIGLDTPVPSEASHAHIYPPNTSGEDRRHGRNESMLQDTFPQVHSRSGSVTSSIFGRQSAQDEDISSIMMRGATDLRNAKFEIEEQVSVQYRL